MKINGNEIPAPTIDSYKIEKNDIDSSNSGRSETGLMLREIIRKRVYKVSAKWRLTSEECASLENLLSQSSFNLTFTENGAEITRNFYCSAVAKSLVGVSQSGQLWALSANMVEY